MIRALLQLAMLVLLGRQAMTVQGQESETTSLVAGNACGHTKSNIVEASIKIARRTLVEPQPKRRC